MKDRITKIITQVRLNLDKVSNDELKTKQIFSKANYIQEEILRETKCNEVEFEIPTIGGQEEYDINLEAVSMVKTMETSWGGPLKYISNNQWNEIGTTGSNRPVYFNLFDKKLRLRPIPISGGETIKIWAYQESLNVPMDEDIEPEIPKYADRCLIMGICSEYDFEKYYPMYMALRSEVAIHAHNKIGAVRREGNLNW